VKWKGRFNLPLTDKVSAETVFAGVLVPLKRVNQRRNVTYFSSGPDAGTETYWGGVISRTGGATQVKSAESGFDALASLEAYWTLRGEAMLVKTLPELRALQEAILKASESTQQPEQSVSEFVYPLY
jgi:hypothetical protein